MNLSPQHTIYLLGIGGIGMSALARYFDGEGYEVSGYDRSASVVTRQLEEMGIAVYYTPDVQRIAEADLVIYTPAIPQDHPEWVAAQELGKTCLKRAEVLGIISQSYRCIAVAGTHGKTTTSTMLAHLLRHAGVEITAFLGGLSVNLAGNFVHGDDEWLVVEADEYDRSFLHLHPEWAIINSLDPDHLDIYGAPEAMVDTYRQFAGQAQELLLHDSLAQQDWGRPYQTFGLAGEARVSRVRHLGLSSTFDLEVEGQRFEGLGLPMPGHHNVMNMAAAATVAVQIGVGEEDLRSGIAAFRGIYRRFEVQAHSEGFTFIDDYAHHPNELRAVIDTARALFPERQLMVLFQPHLYSRTRDFMTGFAEQLDRADVALLMDIYPAREEPIAGVSSEALLTQMQATQKALVARAELADAIQRYIQPPTVLLTLGAGDIDREITQLKAALAKKYTA